MIKAISKQPKKSSEIFVPFKTFAITCGLAIIFFAGTLTFGILYMTKMLPNIGTSAQITNAGLLAQVSKLTTLPNETPTIATVTDPSKLSGQSFFANANLGDKVLIYQNAKEAILYRPSTNAIIQIAPIQ